MLLINSAGFQIADIDASKEIFFVGDNAGGKTTNTRALHFLYNGDGQKLGIPNSKDSFAKHYFPHDDSYIIYVFDTFFIFTYKRQDVIRRWFCKREFDLNEIIKNGRLLDFKEIETYIKDAPLKVKPQTIDEYTSILYGDNKKYSDFSIAKVKNRKIFLDVFNMIFNIDKAIVTAKDIKKAIQKSLDRRDDVLSIDYDDFIRKLNGFSRAYHFFSIFDSSRTHLSNAIKTKDELLDLEVEMGAKSKAINYRHRIEVAEFNKQEHLIKEATEEMKNYKERANRVNALYENGFEKRLSKKIKEKTKKVFGLEKLSEKYDQLAIEENTLLANQFDGIKKELDLKKYSLQKLKDSQTSAQKEIEGQIEQIEYKIEKTIPNERDQNIYKLSEIEKTTYRNEVLEIEKEYESQEDELRERVKSSEDGISSLKESKNSSELEAISKKEDLNSTHESEKKLLEAKEFSITQKIGNIANKTRRV